MRKFKVVVAISLVMIMSLSLLAACGGGVPSAAPASPKPAAPAAGGSAPAAGGSAPAAKKELQLAGLVFSDDQFMNALIRGYKEAAAKYPGVKINTQNVAGDAAREAELINTFIEQKYDGIAIAPLNKDGSIPTLAKAAQAGIKIATTNMDLRKGGADFIIGGFTSDDRENGIACGKYAAEYIKKNKIDPVNVLVIHFDHSLVDQSSARWKGFLQGLEEGGVKYNLLDDQANSQGDPLGLASSMLAAHPEANIFWASNEGSTIATAQAVQAEGKVGKVTVFGYDSSDQTSKMILDDKTALEAVVTQAPYMMGFGAVTLICEHLLNGKDISATKGTTETCPGEVLAFSNPDAVKKWRSDNGLSN